ncbi:MAG: lipoprotein-releasing ABC transporter permease subunit [Nitrospirota bacterium]|jgi:lipoprotein-releasing system permease protein
MNLPYQVFIALRYLKSRKRHRSVSFNTVITVGGVAVGVMALLVVLSVMSGFHEDLQKKILGVSTHVVVLDYSGSMAGYGPVMEEAREHPRVVSASPFVLGQVMISHQGRAQGVFLRGVEPALEAETTDIEAHMTAGSLLGLEGGDGLPGIVLGAELAGRLGIAPGDAVRVVSPTGGTGPLGMIPRQKKFVVVGLFEIGMFEYDSNLALTALGPAQDFLGLDEDSVTGIELRVDDIYRAGEIGTQIEKDLGRGFYSRDWIEMNRNLFAALKLEKLAMFVILALIVLVAAFNIVSTQIMNVIEKEREIAILKAMGASRGGIMSVFMLQGFLIGLLGTAIGITAGYGLNHLIDTYEIIKLPADVYYLSHLPAKMKLSDFVAVSVSAILISFAATIYPAWQAARLNPVEPLRYE